MWRPRRKPCYLSGPHDAPWAPISHPLPRVCAQPHGHRPRTNGEQGVDGGEGGQDDVAAAHQGDGVHRKHVHQVEHGRKVAPHLVRAQVHLWGGGGSGLSATDREAGQGSFVACSVALGSRDAPPPFNPVPADPKPLSLGPGPPEHCRHPPPPLPWMVPSACCSTMRWLSITPLGLPVVPEV